MATKSSFILAILFIANPFMLLFFQNCSAMPKPQASSVQIEKPTSPPPSTGDSSDVVKNN